MQSGRNVTIVSYRATTYEVNETDVDALTSKLDKLQNVASAALTAADLRHPVNGHDVLLDDASAIAILLALMWPMTEKPERVQLGEPGYRLRALRRGLEGQLWPPPSQG